MVDLENNPTFEGGEFETAQEELAFHETLSLNRKKFIESYNIDIIDDENNIDSIAYVPGTTMYRIQLGNTTEYSDEAPLPPSSFESLSQGIMYDLFSRISEERSKSFTWEDVTIKPYPKISQEAIANAKKVVQFSFYSYMFFGVQNLFGLDTNFFGDLVLPYRPDVIIGAMPFYSAQKLERGMSDRILKYRAIGDIFLAHQRGSTDTLRVDMTLFGPYRGWYLLYLLALQQGGESRLKELNLNVVGPVPVENIDIPKTGKLQYESHMTFPIVSQTAIMLDMYLQTIEWHQEKDIGGHEVIFIHLLLRKHIDPISVNVASVDSKKGFLNYGDTLTVRRRKELLFDTIWKCKQIGVEMLKFGLFGGTDMEILDKEAVSSDPYITNIAKLMSGYSFDINNMGSIFGKHVGYGAFK